MRLNPMIASWLKSLTETMQQSQTMLQNMQAAIEFRLSRENKVAMAWRLAMATLKWGQRPGEGDKAFVQA
ncbi:hypothetical protein EFD55_19615 [Rhizobium pisi]|uniref:Uncharacterized protein n=1 Tax=Rhizobium pisi TaxID=574561 RepID=A0A427MWD4_9HYPH|nr:hypothetical protein EFD55_19615 [Rhizobium pisi]